ncbi:hypothetical protein GCM10027277_32890 [Pseudoduganella ginsengisoli]|uniref:Uncharacterized protein n=1 Tax=Pseudoduganella ginsengisoli TaxID=1462440 RepID=A0A6L6Q853_9BURK|nr:hypothetical protein [Pseudoduganella ginsengisoli]MTW05629.1 hypothetical protein [Pseudoduganella ginsengisoli]
MAEKHNELFGDESGHFEEGSAPKNVEHTPFEVRTEFFPWHKPRKHYLRQNQWSKSIATLVDSLKLKDRKRSLHYLSLPGPDLLDVRTLEPMCKLKEVKLSFLGLNDGGSDGEHNKHLNAALLSQVLSLPAIDSMSGVVPDKFEHLAKEKSIAYERIIASHRSFDVINVDLCGTLAEAPPGKPGPTLTNAIFNLINHQAKTRTEDWLLFLTTRSNKDMVDQQTMQKMLDWLNELLATDVTLLQKYIESGFVSNAELTNGRVDLSKLSDKAHSLLFTIGLGHWIFESLFNNQPAWRVDMLPQFGYHVLLRDPTCDMISMGFYCKKMAVAAAQDSMGLAHVPKSNNMPNPADIKKACFEKIHRRVQETCDVDVKLHVDQELYKNCLNESAELLKGALYDHEKYKEFAEAQRKIMEIFLMKHSLVATT